MSTIGEYPPFPLPLFATIVFFRRGNAVSNVARIRDWTHGCIAVTESEIEEIWRLVELGAVVEVRP